MQRILAQAVRSAKKKAIAALAVGVSSGAGAVGRPSEVKGSQRQRLSTVGLTTAEMGSYN